jgi:hypothetical protein
MSGETNVSTLVSTWDAINRIFGAVRIRDHRITPCVFDSSRISRAPVALLPVSDFGAHDFVYHVYRRDHAVRSPAFRGEFPRTTSIAFAGEAGAHPSAAADATAC